AGHDVISTRAPDPASEKLEQSQHLVQQQLKNFRQELQDGFDVDRANTLSSHADQWEREIADLAGHAQAVIAHYRRGDLQAARDSRDLMERRFASVRSLSGVVDGVVETIQQEKLAEHHAFALGLRRFEYLVPVSVLVMILAAVAYGRKI